jgi:hypothetical protein
MAGFCQTTQGTSAPPVWADPLGSVSTGKGGAAQYGASGAPQMRSQLFNYMQGISPQMASSSQDTASRLTSSANDPFWGSAQQQARDTMAGRYLAGSPQLDRAMAANTSRALSSAADEDARLKSQFGKTGMGFSTGYQQASQANRSALMADAARGNAATYLQNYMAERANQNAAPGAYQQAQTAPLNYLSQVPSTLMAPLNQQGNLLTALSSGGQVVTPNSTETYTPSMAANVMQGIGASSSLFSALKSGNL